MTSTIVEQHFVHRSIWNAAPGNEIISFPDKDFIIEARWCRDDTKMGVGRLVRVPITLSVRIEADLPDTRMGYLMRRMNGVYAVVGDAGLWEAEDLPPEYVVLPLDK
jgi:hypothetical protein